MPAHKLRKDIPPTCLLCLILLWVNGNNLARAAGEVKKKITTALRRIPMLRVRPTNFRLIVSLSLTAFLYLCMVPVASPWNSARTAAQTAADDQNPNIPVIPPGSAYRQTNFISDSPGVAFVLD